MDTSDTASRAVTTSAELNESLIELVRTAYENGVDIEGGWECRNPSDYPDWEVVIFEITKGEDDRPLRGVPPD